MTIEEMKARKTELGYTNETVARLSGVPLGTIQKIFAGETKSPRYDTIQKLTKVLDKPARESLTYEYNTLGDGPRDSEGASVSETSELYEYGRGGRRISVPLKEQCWNTGSMGINEYLKPPKKRIGIADGKYKMPPDELFFNDEISEMFEDL